MQPREPHRGLLVIRERDVGMFSMVWQVLHTLFLLEHPQINRIPVVIMGRAITYFHKDGHEGRRTAWEYYFEPLVAGVSEDHVLDVLGGRALELLESKRRYLEHVRGSIEFPDSLHLLTPLTIQDRLNLTELNNLVDSGDWAWTESFQPEIDGKSFIQTKDEKAKYSPLVQRHIRPREHIQKKVCRLFDARLRDFHIIGVHVRGTDAHSTPGRGIEIPFDRYFGEIEKRLATVGREACRIFLATDEQYVISRFEERFGDLLVYYDAVRNVDNENVFGTGPTGKIVPAYITKGDTTAVQNGEDAVAEYTLLCKSDLLVHNFSSLSLAARLSVPASIQV